MAVVKDEYLLSFLACLPLIDSYIPAIFYLDQLCLGGLWTRSGYQRVLESDKSDLFVLASAKTLTALQQRMHAGQNISSQALQPSSAAAVELLGVGCLWAILEEAHITTLAVEPAHQRQKLGQLLLRQLLLSGHYRGLSRASLEVRASNQKALALYQKFDFKEAGQRPRYYADGENARILWHSGLQTPNCVNQLRIFQQSAITHIEKTGNYQYFAEIT